MTGITQPTIRTSIGTFTFSEASMKCEVTGMTAKVSVQDSNGTGWALSRTIVLPSYILQKTGHDRSRFPSYRMQIDAATRRLQPVVNVA